jgi:hypothetical protein
MLCVSDFPFLVLIPYDQTDHLHVFRPHGPRIRDLLAVHHSFDSLRVHLKGQWTRRYDSSNPSGTERVYELSS